MKTVSHREMRNNSGEILRAVAAGESVQVTNNGRIAAIISPPVRPGLDELAALGRARPARRPRSQLATIRRRSVVLSSSALVADVRGRW